MRLAAGTIGTLIVPPYALKPMFFSSRYRTMPLRASRPNALPPESEIAKICCTRFTGFRRSVSADAGAAPRTSTPAVAPPSTRIAVQPVGRSVRVKWPTLTPGTAVSVKFAGGVCARPTALANATTTTTCRIGLL